MSGLHIDPTTRDAVLTVGNDLERPVNPTAASAYRRVATQRGSVFWDTGFGSTLHEIRTVDQFTPGRVEASVRGALQPMLDSGEITALTVSAERASDMPGRVDILIDATDRLRRPFRIPTWVQV